MSRQDFLCFLTSADNLPAGSNQTIDTLCRGLFALIEKREAHVLMDIPSELFVQLDNTTKDNKNRFFFAFCDYPIHTELFVKIMVNLVPIGHTHEDIDRKFSHVSSYLTHRKVSTVTDLHEALRKSQNARAEPFVTRLEVSLTFRVLRLETKLL